MALTTAEIARIKFELGYNVLSVGAEPYVGVTQLFDQVIAPYTQAGAVTTSSTAVTAASTPTLVSITLASAAGVSAGDRVVVDVEDAQEITTVRSLSGAVASLFLQKAHPPTYPVTVEGGESIVRGILTELRAFSERGGYLSKLGGSAGIKKVDEVEFFDSAATSQSSQRRKLQAMWRDELASALGCENRRRSAGGGASVSLF